MDLAFANGTDLQKSACRTVAHNLLNLPFDAIPVSVSVEFVADPDASQHNEFAVTSYSYNGGTAEMKMSSRLPNWSAPYDGVKFLQECFGHELGHAVFANLTHEARLAVVKLFGGTTDSLAVINNLKLNWKNRIIEGIAETFKDAFLPRQFRRYSNRTNELISIAQYPEFRRLFREGIVTDDLQFLSPDSTDAYRTGGKTGAGLFTGDFSGSPSFSSYLATGEYVQLASPGETLIARIERIVSDGLVDFYDLRPRMTMGWPLSLIGGPDTAFTLPPNNGAGWRFAVFGDADSTFSGGDFTFTKPMYAYSGEVAELIPKLKFIYGSGGSADIISNFQWDSDVDLETFIAGSPPMMGVQTKTADFPSSGISSYIFSSIAVPIGDPSTAVLQLAPGIFAENFDGSPPDADAFRIAVGDLLRGQGSPIAVPSGSIQPGGVRSGVRPSTSRVVGR